MSPGLVVCILIKSLWQKMRKSVFKELVTFIVALSSSEKVQGLTFPICSQQSSFYVSLSARKEKKDTQSERYRTPIEKIEKEVGGKGS